MKHFLPTLGLVLALCAGPSSAPAAPLGTPHRPLAADTATVYVCMSGTSYAYHSSSDCAGLNRCSHPVKALRQGEAEKLGKRACKKCW